jgi:opacity protein-like surface antigen
MKRWIGFVVLFCLLLPREGQGRQIDPYIEVQLETLHRDLIEENASFLGQNFPDAEVSAQSLRLLGVVGVRLFDVISLYGLAGGSDLAVDDFGFHSDLSGAYGGGIELRVQPEAAYHLFAHYRYLRTEAKDSVRFAPGIDFNEDGFIGPGELLADEQVTETLEWTEHVVKLGMRVKHDMFEPYGGVRVSWVRGTDHIPSQIQPLKVAFKQDASLGLFLGTAYSLPAAHGMALFIEGSLLDQYSLTGGIRIGF